MSPMSESLMPVGVEGFTCCVGIFEMMKGGYVKVAKDKKIGIYKITNTTNNKVYIGQSQDIVTRLRGHKATLKVNTHFNIHLQRAYNKYGINSFSYETLEECSEDIINERESYWIEFYNSRDRFHGYNIDYGGTKDVFSEEHKINISIRRKGTYEIDATDIEITYLEIQDILKQKTKNEKLLLYAMFVNSKRYSDDNSAFYMSYKEMSRKTGIKSKNTLIKIINQFISSGIIDIVSRNTIQTNSYKINYSIDDDNNKEKFIVNKEETNYLNSFVKCLFKFYDRKELKKMLNERYYLSICKLYKIIK